MAALFEAYKEDFDILVNDFFEANGEAPFPWVVQVPLKDKIYMANIEFVDYISERESYIIKTVIVEENQVTGDVIEHVHEEECHETDFETFMGEIIDAWKSVGFYPAEESDFELDIYDWVEENKNKEVSADIFSFIIKKCKESEEIFLAEKTRVEYLALFDKKEDEDD